MATTKQTKKRRLFRLNGCPVLEYRTLTPYEREQIMAAVNSPPWPWKDMEPWEIVIVAPHLATWARQTVHAYASKSGKRFATRLLMDKSLQVMRTNGNKFSTALWASPARYFP